ncbi:MAG: hypothetical protein DWI57_16455 [Chloroflexi bacterium]|nr:MAG: hypothetical protein DWI57_16455 [Chloroflexota bacterium]
MTVESLTITLPETIVRRLRQAAQSMQVSIGDVLAQTIQGNLPPALVDLPDDMQKESILLQNADNATLWRIARESLPAAQQEMLEELLERNREETLSVQEAEKLAHLREIIDRLVMRRSYALALLKWRGHTITSKSNSV